MAVKKNKVSSSNLEAKVIDLIPVSDNQKKIFTRRLNKLRRDPKEFIENSYKKRSAQVLSKLPIKHKGTHDFTVVSAVYNVEKYLDDYFVSIVNQTLSFKKHIQLILVDDGSTDNSAKIIRKWQKRYPKNITYIYEENGGQASARNLGLGYVKTEWVTFIDPDDFISKSYFYQIDQKINSNKNIKIVCCKKVYFSQNSRIFSDNHSLDYRFKDSKNLVSCNNLQENIIISILSTVLHTNSIPPNLRFDENLEIDFGDIKFINIYLLNQKNSSLLYFHSEAKYFIRDYNEKKLSADAVWLNKDKFSTVLKEGYLDIFLESHKRLSYIPRYLQRTILWEVLKYIRYLLNHEERASFLTVDERIKFFYLIKEIFKYIDPETILSFNLGSVAFFYKVGMLECFKNIEVPQQSAYINKIDNDKGLFLIRFFSINDPLFQLLIDKKDVLPHFYKKSEKFILGINFITEHYIWYPIIHNIDIRFLINNKKAIISYKGKRYKDLLPKKMFYNNRIKKNSLWVFMDRDDRAGDNAEFIYGFVKNNYLDQDICFVLNKNSEDWNRLEEKGFELINHGSEEHRIALNNCTLLISSQTNRLIEPFRDIEKNYKIVFLQHGVIKDDMSNWLNRIELDLMITSTLGEYNSITNNDSHYKYGEKEVKLTGLARFDSLHENKGNYKNQAFIMFTWRKSIAGSFVANEKSEREFNDDFKNTTYFNKINNFLNSEVILSLYENYGTRFLICPHPNMEAYIDCFDFPHYIKLASNQKTIHQLVNESFMLITDYSSISFDFAYQNKPVLYYQFDKDDMFSGNHTFIEGYFSYEEDGFGPVVTEESELLVELEQILNNNGEPVEPYVTRIQDTFAYHDTNNCQRIYEAIIDLDRLDDQEINIGLLYDMTVSAYNSQLWDLAESRSDLLIQHGDDEQIAWAKQISHEALFHQNKFAELFESLEGDSRMLKETSCWRAKVAFTTAHWQDTIKLLETKPVLDDELMFMLLFSYAEIGQIDDFEKLKREVQDIELSPVQSIMIQAWSLRLYDQWDMLVHLLDIELTNFNVQELRDYQPQVLMAQAYRHLSEFTEAHQQLADFESHTSNNPRCRIEIARLAFARENYGKCINQYDSIVNDDISLLPEIAIEQYMLSHWNMEHIEELITVLPEVIDLYPNNPNFNLLYIRALAEQSQWAAIIEQASLLEEEQKIDIIYPLTLARYRMGYIDDAYQNSIRPTNQHSYKYWSLIAEIALLVEDIELAKYCYKGMIAIYPDDNILDNWTKLNNLRHYA